MNEELIKQLYSDFGDQLGAPSLDAFKTALQKPEFRQQFVTDFGDSIGADLTQFDTALGFNQTDSVTQEEAIQSQVENPVDLNKVPNEAEEIEEQPSLLKRKIRQLRVSSELLGGMIARVPEMLYRTITWAPEMAANAIEKVTGVPVPSIVRPPSVEEITEGLGLPKNRVAEMYDRLAAEGIAEHQKRFDKTLSEYAVDGQWGKFVDSMSDQVLQSAAPTIAAIAATAAGAGPVAMTTGGGVLFGAGELGELKDNTDLSEAEKTSIAFTKGMLEGLFETWGISRLGAGFGQYVKKRGLEGAQEVAKETFLKAYARPIRKYLGIGAEEFVTEAATQFSQDLVDKYGGVDPSLTIEQIASRSIDAGLVGLGAGGFYAGPTLASNIATTASQRNKARDLERRKQEIEQDLATADNSFIGRELDQEHTELVDQELEVVKADKKKYDSLSEENKAKALDLRTELNAVEEHLAAGNLSQGTLDKLKGRQQQLQAQLDELFSSRPEQTNLEPDVADQANELAPEVAGESDIPSAQTTDQTEQITEPTEQDARQPDQPVEPTEPDVETDVETNVETAEPDVQQPTDRAEQLSTPPDLVPVYEQKTPVQGDITPYEGTDYYVREVRDGEAKLIEADENGRAIPSGNRVNIPITQLGQVRTGFEAVEQKAELSPELITEPTESSTELTDEPIPAQEPRDPSLVRQTALRLVNSSKLKQSTKDELQKQINEGTFDKDQTIPEVERQIKANEALEQHGDNFRALAEDVAYDTPSKQRALEKAVADKNRAGDIYGASVAALELTKLASQAGRDLQSFKTREGTDTVLESLATQYSEAAGRRMEQPTDVEGNKTVKQALDETIEKLRPDETKVDQLVDTVLLKERPKKKLTADEQIQRGLKQIRDSGFTSGGPFQAFPGLVDVIVGLARKFAGNVDKMRQQFVKDLGKDSGATFDQAIRKQEIKQAIVLEQVVDNIKQHYSDESTSTLQEKLEQIDGLSKAKARQIAENSENIYKDLFRDEVRNSLKGVTRSRKKVQAVLAAASKGYLSNSKGLELLHQEFKIPYLTEETKAAVQEYADIIEKAVAKGGGYNVNRAERKIREILKTADASNVQLLSEAVRDVFMANILSGFSTQSRALFGAAMGNFGEFLVEGTRGVVEGRSRRLGVSWMKEAGKNMFSEAGFRAGIQAYKEILRHGSTDLSFADTAEINQPRALDIFINKWDKGKGLKGAARNSARVYLAANILMYRNLIALDYIMKSGMVEFFGFVEAYNKALSQNGKLAGPKLLTEVNKLLAVDQMGEIRQRVDQEIKDGRTAKNKRSVRIKQLLLEARDGQVRENANARAMEALMMNNNTTGRIPGWIRKAGSNIVPSETDSAATKTGKMFLSYMFPIIRVPANALTRLWQFSPLGLVEGVGSMISPQSFQRAQYDPTTNKVESTPRTVEQRKLALYRGAVGSSMGLLGWGLFHLLTDKDEDDKRRLKDSSFQITGPGTGDFIEDLNKFGQDYQSMRFKTPLGDLEYMDSHAGMAFMVLGYYLDKVRAGEFEDEQDLNDMFHSLALGVYNSSFAYSFEQMVDILDYMWDTGADQKRTAQLLAGDLPQTSKEKAFVRAIGDKASAQIWGNLYKQTYKWVDAVKDEPIRTGSTIQQRLSRYVPYIHSRINDEILDAYGTPIEESYELPFPLKPISTIVDRLVVENSNTPEKIKDWIELKQQLNIKEPTIYYPRTYGNKLDLPESVTKKAVSEYKKLWGQYIAENVDEFKEMDKERIERKLESAKSRLSGQIKNSFFKNDTFVSKMWEIDAAIEASEGDKQELLRSLETLKRDLTGPQYRERKRKLEAL